MIVWVASWLRIDELGVEYVVSDAGFGLFRLDGRRLNMIESANDIQQHQR
jgi:hypothetical protein